MDGPGGVFSLWALLTCPRHVGRKRFAADMPPACAKRLRSAACAKRFAYGTLSGGLDTHPPDGMPCLGGR